MADQYWCTPLGPHATAIGSTVGTVTTSDITPNVMPIMFGGQMRAGSIIELEAEGEYTCLTSATLILGFYFGGVLASTTLGTVLGASGTITAGTSPTAWPWHMKWRGKFNALGTAGSVVGQGFLDFGTSLTVYSTTVVPITQALRTVAIDTTTNKTLGVGATYGASSASNTIRCNNFSALNLN